MDASSKLVHINGETTISQPPTHTASGNARNIWKNKRDRDRMHARHEIRERVRFEGEESSLISSATCVNNCNRTVRSLFGSIEKRDMSAFGIAKLAKNLSATSLDGLHPALSYLNLQKAYYMCVSRFGVEFGKSVLKYLESIRGISLVAYASMLGEYQIVNSLLKAGADPTIRPCRSCSSASTNTTNPRSQSLQQKFHRLFFLDYFPPMLAVWIVRCVVVMRINGVYTQEDKAKYGTIDEKQNNSNFTCEICESENDHGLNWGAPCYHSFCEYCCWEDILNQMDDRDEILCPICLAERKDKPLKKETTDTKTNDNNCRSDGRVVHDSNLPQESRTAAMTPMERFCVSLEKFQALPPTKDQHVVDSSNSEYETDISKAMIQYSKRKNKIDTSWSSSLIRYIGRTQETRNVAFFHFVARGAIHYVKGILEAGVYVDAVNEYNQTNLYIASWYGHTTIVKMLLHYGADPNILPHGATSKFFRSTALSVAKAHNHQEIVEILSVAAVTIFSSNNDQTLPLDAEDSVLIQSSLMNSKEFGKNETNSTEECNSTATTNVDFYLNRLLPLLPALTMLIPPTMKDHPGAGSFIIDHTISEIILQKVDALWKSLPADYGRKGKENAITCATRSYFCDAENLLTKYILNQVYKHALLQDCSVIVMPHMRFLHYAHPNISLPSHVDLARVDRFGRRSTHSFLLYLFDCEHGGETILHRRQVNSTKEEQVEEGVVVKPKRGRLLVFPHLCPHEGSAVITVPKVLIRGEIYMGCS